MYSFKKQMSGPGYFANANPSDFSTRAVDASRPIKVIVIGGGMSGIIAGIFFPRSIENLDLKIYEKNADLGGTWFENKYPGLACDIPSHVYQFTFDSNSQWSSYYAPGPEIQAYLKRIAEKYKATKYMNFNRKVTKAEWHDEEGKWYVTVQNTSTGESFVDSADVICSAVGITNVWKWPDIPGLDSFKGKLVHSANYDTSYDITGKRVALLGAGSTGIQILPQIQPKAAHVDHYVRSRTWIAPAGIGGEGIMHRGGNPLTPAEELERFKDPAEYLAYRRGVENILHRPVEALYLGSDGSKNFFDMCYDHMKTKLAKKPEIFEQLVPDFPPGCKRLTPGPGYLEALVEDNVEFISTHIKEVHPDGIVTQDGKKRLVDTIICATGFDGVYKQHFPVLGKNGVNLQDLWKEMPEAYISMAPRQMPNYFLFLGPNGGPGLGSAVPFLENEAKYMIKAIQKIQREWIKSMVAKEEAIQAFAKYAVRYLNTTIFSANCKAWWSYKGRLLAIWPGSQLHGSYIFENPRWEDYDYEIRPELNGNPLEWFGNGLAKGQIAGEDTTRYLDGPALPVDNPLEARQEDLQKQDQEAGEIVNQKPEQANGVHQPSQSSVIVGA